MKKESNEKTELIRHMNSNLQSVNNSAVKQSIGKFIKSLFSKIGTEYNKINSYNTSNTTSDHRYDFKNLSKADIKYINKKIKEASSYPAEDQAIKLAESIISTIYAPKPILNRYIILKYGNSEIPNDILAVAVSYSNSGAFQRKYAIAYFEKYLSFYNTDIDSSYPLTYNTPFSFQFIYMTLATLYEKEYMFEKAYSYRMKLIDMQNYTSGYDLICLGNILKKLDINKCVEFYERAYYQEEYYDYKNIIAEQLAEAKEKQSRNYKYRPRPKQKDAHTIDVDNEITECALKFINGYYQ